MPTLPGDMKEERIGPTTEGLGPPCELCELSLLAYAG